MYSDAPECHVNLKSYADGTTSKGENATLDGATVTLDVVDTDEVWSTVGTQYDGEGPIAVAVHTTATFAVVTFDEAVALDSDPWDFAKVPPQITDGLAEFNI